MIIDIEYCNVPLTIKGTYIEEEPRVDYYPDGSGYPGYPSDFEIRQIMCGEIDLQELLTYDQTEKIREIILKQIEE
jgi:hypothetical protein